MKITRNTFFTIKTLAIILLGFNMSIHSQIIQVEEGSYTKTFPGSDSAGRNGFPSGSPQVTGNALGKPVPTNDWWSKLLKENHADNLFNYPMTMKTTNTGLIVTYIPTGPIGDSAPIEVSLSGLNTPRTNVSDFSDWTVTMNWKDSDNELKATSGIGMPFIYFEKDADDIAEIKINSGNATINDELLIIENATSGQDFVFYAPVGSIWQKSGNIYKSTLNGKKYWSLAMLPQNTGDVNGTANSFKKYAYVFPKNSTTSWNFNETNSKVTTTFLVETEVKEGTEDKMLLGLLPHQWFNLSSNSPEPNVATYHSVRGNLKMLASNSFIVENTYKGILPTIPYLANYSQGFSPSELSKKIKLIENDGLATWTDSYNEGQVMNRLIQTARIANQTGNILARDKMIATVKERLEDWLTYENGEVAFLFYYNSDWTTMLGYPAGHDQDTNVNDHHFHWGYFIHAAAFIEQFEPGWANKWGGMINTLIRDASSPNRNDELFPFLRNFSPYAGHSWANGFASFPHGNDQESTSESMQFASSLIHWGTITNNIEIRDLGIYIYTTEQTAVEEYWFDMYDRNFDANHPYSIVSRVWGNWYDNGTFWTSDIEASYGIELYPIHGGSFYLGHNQSYAQKLWNEIESKTVVLNNVEHSNLWYDTYWKYLSMSNPQKAVDLYTAYPERNLKFGISDAQTYHWLHSINAMGIVDATITADYPIAVVFKQNGEKTYVAHNYSNSEITVTYSDGFQLAVPKNTLKTNRDVEVSGVITSDVYQTSANGTANLSLQTNGTGITKVEFYKNDVLLSEDFNTPFQVSASNLLLGIHSIYAKIYVNNNFVISNVISIQVGEQKPYNNVLHVIPGTIEAGHYDYFEGGNGQDISYFDSSKDNQGNFRTNEYVDVLTVTNEGATVGWISANEWLEYTIDVQTTGCYDLNFRYASGNTSGGGPFYFEIDGQKVSSNIALSATGDWSNWNTKTTNINLTKGKHVLRLAVSNGEFNIGKMTFTFNNDQECSSSNDITGLPFDFESIPVTADFNNFDGGTATVEAVTSPQNNGNSSNKLAKIIRNGGQPWAGSYLNLKSPLDFSSNKYILLKLWTAAPVGTSVQIKLEQQNGNSAFYLAKPTTVSEEWETLFFDFSSQGVSSFDKLVFMFDINNIGNGSATSTFYFDDVQQTNTLSKQDFSLSKVSIYPNPANKILNISSIKSKISKIEIYSVLGKKVLEFNSNIEKINIEDLSSGLYLIKLYSNKSSNISKFYKE